MWTNVKEILLLMKRTIKRGSFSSHVSAKVAKKYADSRGRDRVTGGELLKSTQVGKMNDPFDPFTLL